MSDLVGCLANCIIEGDSFSEVNGKRIKNKIKFRLKNKIFEIVQSPELFNIRKSIADYQGKFIQSTKVVISDVEKEDIGYYSDIILKLVSLLSFITTSQVVCLGFEYPAGKIRQIFAVVGRTNIMHNVLELHRGDEIKEFIVSTWKKFEDNYDKRRLSLIFEFIFQAFSINTIETKLVFTYVTLESLKYTFAKSKGLRFKNGSFWKNKKQRYNFEELINLMLLDVNINVDMKEFLELRNDIIHSGYTDKSFQENHRIFLICQHIIREYLIRLLGYEGYYIKVR
jgi:hypothetical protein